MRRTLRLSGDAINDAEAIRRWLTQPGSGKKAAARLRAIRMSVDLLKETPCLYPAGDIAGLREAPLTGGYRVIYRVDPDTGRNDTAGDVLILRIFGPGQSRDGA